MFIPISFFCILLTTIIQCENITVRFSKFPVDTDIGSCTCDLTASECDTSCCCDPECSPGDRQVFECSSRENQYTNSTPVISTVQPSCFKNISIFRSTSPYIIQKMGELVCVDYQRYTGSQYYQQPVVQTLDPSVFVQAINTEYSVSPPFTLSTNVTNYQVGTPILSGTATSTASIYSLPVNLFNSQLCSGTQTITYMNDFTSTCSQVVNAATCAGALSPSTYINSLCFIRAPSSRDDTSVRICPGTTAPFLAISGSTCPGAVKSLTVTIFYSNPTGIVSVNLTYSPQDAPDSTPFEQTFIVKFIKNGLSLSSNATRNPGYLQGANIIAGTRNGSAIDTISSSLFSILKPSSTGTCGGNSERIPIRFGENIRSSCRYTTTSPTCADLHYAFMPIPSSNLYVAAYSNPDRLNVTRDWLPAKFCTSRTGIPNQRECSNGIIINATSNGLCYSKLDIQIAYTNIGSIGNPQPVLSAVIFHYQRLSDTQATPTTPILVMESVTFQDILNAPIVEQGQIPTPNTRLPANFFYPFTVSKGTKSMTFSSFVFLLISVLCILI